MKTSGLLSHPFLPGISGSLRQHDVGHMGQFTRWIIYSSSSPIRGSYLSGSWNYPIQHTLQVLFQLICRDDTVIEGVGQRPAPHFAITARRISLVIVRRRGDEFISRRGGESRGGFQLKGIDEGVDRSSRCRTGSGDCEIIQLIDRDWDNLMEIGNFKDSGGKMAIGRGAVVGEDSVRVLP